MHNPYLPEVSVRGSRMRQQIRVGDRGFGWAWVGVGALVVVGLTAVVFGQRHEVEHQLKQQGLRP